MQDSGNHDKKEDHVKLIEDMASGKLLISTWRNIRKGTQKVRKGIDSGVGAVTREIMFRDTPVVNDKVLFMTYRNEYECNPKYILEKMIELDLPYDLVWVRSAGTNVDTSAFPKSVRLVERGSYEFFNELASAHVWVDNALNCEWTRFKKKEGEQVYINTWHGSMGLKRIDKNSGQTPKWLSAAKRVTKYVDYMVSDSKFENMVYRTTYWPETEILEYGHPRNDALVIRNEAREKELRERLSGRYGFDLDDKLLIYAPTFRDSGELVGHDLEFHRIVEALEERFGGTWRVLSRMHFHDRKKTSVRSKSSGNRVIDVTDYLDMQELLAVADAGLTDYSSWCCDYVLTGKPCFIYAPDYEEYKQGRGLYYPLEETPFPLALERDELCDKIRTFDEALYAQKKEEFLAARGSFEDGHAADRVVGKIIDIVEAGR